MSHHEPLLSDEEFIKPEQVAQKLQLDIRTVYRYIRSQQMRVVRLPDIRYGIEATIFPGLLLLAGIVVFLFRPDRRRLPLAASVGMLFVLGLGPSLKVAGNFVWKHGGEPVSWLPYRLLLAIPGLGALRAPVRVEYVLVALLVAATAIALDRLLRRDRGYACLIGSAAGVLLATNLLVPLPTTTFGTTAAGADALREIAHVARPGDTVLNVPADCDPSFVSLQIFHHSPVVGCAGSFAANPWSKLRAYTRSGALTKLRCDQTAYGRLPTTTRARTAPFEAGDVTALRADLGVRFVVIDEVKLRAGCAGVNAALPVLREHRSLGRDARFEVIDLAQPAGH